METKILYKLFESYGIQDVLPLVQSFVVHPLINYFVLTLKMKDGYERQYLGVFTTYEQAQEYRNEHLKQNRLKGIRKSSCRYRIRKTPFNPLDIY